MQSLLPRIRFWNQKLVRHGYASVSNKITALNGDDVCSIYGCGTDFLLELAGGAAPGGHYGLFVSNTTQLGVGGGGGRMPQRVPPLPPNSTILTFVTASTPFANVSVGTHGNALTFLLCSNATVHLSGSFWALVNEVVLETVAAASGAILSNKTLFPTPRSGQVQHSFSLLAGETVVYTKIGHHSE